MGETNLVMVRGDTLSFAMEIEGLDQDLDTAYFTAKANYTTNTPLFRKSLENGIEKVSAGLYRIRVAPSDTAGAQTGMYFYDLEIGVNSDIFTIMRGSLSLEPEVS